MTNKTLKQYENVAKEGLTALTGVLAEDLITYIAKKEDKFQLGTFTDPKGLKYNLTQLQKNKIIRTIDNDSAEIFLQGSDESSWFIMAEFNEEELIKFIKNLKPIINHYNCHYYDGYGK